jgi:hypothetical protein
MTAKSVILTFLYENLEDVTPLIPNPSLDINLSHFQQPPTFRTYFPNIQLSIIHPSPSLSSKSLLSK